MSKHTAGPWLARRTPNIMPDDETRRCRTCGGTGVVRGIAKCYTCKGTGLEVTGKRPLTGTG